MELTRTQREEELLKARAIIEEALRQALAEPVVRLRLYRKLLVKWYICDELLIEERKRKLKIS